MADEVPEGGGDGWDFWIEDGIRDIVLLRVDSDSGIPVVLNLKKPALLPEHINEASFRQVSERQNLLHSFASSTRCSQ